MINKKMSMDDFIRSLEEEGWPMCVGGFDELIKLLKKMSYNGTVGILYSTGINNLGQTFNTFSIELPWLQNLSKDLLYKFYHLNDKGCAVDISSRYLLVRKYVYNP